MAIGFSSSPRDIRELGIQKNVRGKKTRNPGWEPGNHWVQCDRCSSIIRAKDAMITWDHLVVCPDDWEIRHPQDFVRGRYDDITAKEPRRPEGADIGIDGEPLSTTTGSSSSSSNQFYELPMGSIEVSQNLGTLSGGLVTTIVDKYIGNKDTKLFTVQQPPRVSQFTFNTDGDLSTLTFDKRSDQIVGISTVSAIAFSILGDKMFVADLGDDVVIMSLDTPWDVGSFTIDQISQLGPQLVSIVGLTFNTAGTKMWFVAGTPSLVREFTLSSAYDIDSKVETATFNYTAGGVSSSARDFKFSNDGLRFYILDAFGDTHQYNMTSPYDITTASFSKDSPTISQGNGMNLYQRDAKSLIHLVNSTVVTQRPMTLTTISS